MKKFDLLPLWDLYGGLLTETQRDICNLYFNLDLTVSEIASERGASRQAISECLKTCSERLIDFEEKCGAQRQLEKSSSRAKEIFDEVDGFIKETGERHPEAADELAAFLEALGKKYGK